MDTASDVAYSRLADLVLVDYTPFPFSTSELIAKGFDPETCTRSDWLPAHCEHMRGNVTERKRSDHFTHSTIIAAVQLPLHAALLL